MNKYYIKLYYKLIIVYVKAVSPAYKYSSGFINVCLSNVIKLKTN